MNRPNNTPDQNEEIKNGLYRAIELVEFAQKSGLSLKRVSVANAEPVLVFHGQDDEPQPAARGGRR